MHLLINSLYLYISKSLKMYNSELISCIQGISQILWNTYSWNIITYQFQLIKYFIFYFLLNFRICGSLFVLVLLYYRHFVWQLSLYIYRNWQWFDVRAEFNVRTTGNNFYRYFGKLINIWTSLSHFEFQINWLSMILSPLFSYNS